jgi:hypothetical protein
MSKTCFQINKERDFLYRGQAYTPPAPSYLSFLTCTKGARQNSTAYSLNDTIALVPTGKTRLQLYKCTTAGTTAASQGALYPGVVAEVIADGSAVFTEQSTALLNTSSSGIPAAAVEPSIGTGNYARQAMTNSLAGVNATQGGTGSSSTGTSGNVSNATTITWGSPSSNWASSPVGIWAVARFDQASGGNLLEVCPDTTVRNVASGDQAPIINAAALVFNEA